MNGAYPYPEPPKELCSLRPRHIMRYVGPGVIIASVTIGSGELVWASRSGAIFGYALFWCFLYGGLFKAVQVYTAARHMTLTGEHPILAWRLLPGRPFPWFPILIAAPAVALMPIAFSAVPEILATFIHRLTGIVIEGPPIGRWEHLEFWHNIWATATLIVCLILSLVSSYDLLERVSIVVLGVMVLCITASVIVFFPDLPELFSGLFIPTIPRYEPWIVQTPEYAKAIAARSPWLEISVYLAAVGGGAYDYIGYIGMLRKKGWGLAGEANARSVKEVDKNEPPREPSEEEIRMARIWIRAPLLDTIISFALVILVTLLFATLGSVILHREHIIPVENDMLSAQESFLTILHPSLAWLYRLGVFLAFIGTLYGAFEVYRHTFLESLAAIAPGVVKKSNTVLWGRVVVAYCCFGGLTLIWLPSSIAGNIVDRLTFGTIISGAASCGLWCFAMLWVDRKRLPAPLRMSRGMQAVVWLAGFSMTGMGLQAILVYFGSR